MHERSSLIFLDIMLVNNLLESDLFDKSLLLEISDCVFIRKCEKVVNTPVYVVVLQMVHQKRAVALMRNNKKSNLKQEVFYNRF